MIGFFLDPAKAAMDNQHWLLASIRADPQYVAQYQLRIWCLLKETSPALIFNQINGA